MILCSHAPQNWRLQLTGLGWEGPKSEHRSFPLASVTQLYAMVNKGKDTMFSKQRVKLSSDTKSSTIDCIEVS